VPLTIAGSDPSGGAGLQADLKIFLRFGFSGAAVPTAVTVQSPTGVRSANPLPAALVKAQLEALLADVRPAAVKVGMLGSADSVRVVARALAPLARRGIPIVLDPALCSSDGERLIPAADVPVLVRQLVPLAMVVMPNLQEAAEMLGRKEEDVRTNPDRAAKDLMRAGARAVLLKGGHMTSEEATDLLATRTQMILFSLPRVPRRRQVHGTGCALSAATAALLARGQTLEQAVQGAKEFVTAAIAGARAIGRGARQLDFLVANG